MADIYEISAACHSERYRGPAGVGQRGAVIAVNFIAILNVHAKLKINTRATTDVAKRYLDNCSGVFATRIRHSTPRQPICTRIWLHSTSLFDL
ncbi:unnamed protein product [Leptosia nina]|uniref:Uncharacterized protein n=1 Tax=Leptosia nina TaxID=320188 RepID=A0AAV1JME7_9NEOP